MNKNRIYPTYFVFGALLLYTVLFVLPSVIGLGYSFTDWSVYSDEIRFVGLKNFATVFSSEYNYTRMLTNTLRFTVVTTLVKNALGLALAVLLTKQVKLLNFHRAVMYLPCVLSALIVGMIFKSVMNPKIGMLNTFLRGIGLNFLASNWLTDPKIAFRSVMAVDIWKGMGYIMTILIAGIMSIPQTYYEAASIDGCGPVRTFFEVVLPMLKPTLISVGILEIMWVWNDYLLPVLVLDINKYRTIPIHIQYLKGSYGTVDLGATMALILLSIIPVIIFYLACQKHIIKGVAAGAVKG